MNRYWIQVSAGNGPIEVRWFVARLVAWMREVCAARGLLVEDTAVRGDEAAPLSVEMRVLGDAPALLAEECGTHALVQRSASRGKSARKRWFAGVALHAAFDWQEPREATIDPRDLTISATRSSGPGGQHVNKTSTAVRVHHLPSGITVRASDERSQRANIRRAVERIAEQLAQAAARRREEGGARRRRGHHHIERGAPVRTHHIDARGALERGDSHAK